MERVEPIGLEESIVHREKIADFQIRLWALELKINHISGPEDLKRVLSMAMSLRGEMENMKAAGRAPVLLTALIARVDRIIDKLEREQLVSSVL